MTTAGHICDPEGVKRRMVAIRNFLILAVVASLGLVWSDGLGASETALSQIMLVLFLAALALMAYRYFRENRLKWLVIKPWLRGVIIACAVGIVFLVAAGPALLADTISTGGVFLLVAALVLIIVWIVYQSRRY
jgi:amino acid transporter